MDVSLLSHQLEMLMPTVFDSCCEAAGERAHALSAELAALPQLRSAQIQLSGFKLFSTDWWHFHWVALQSMPKVR
jgi:D-alanyl-D-alanine dipeptidase